MNKYWGFNYIGINTGRCPSSGWWTPGTGWQFLNKHSARLSALFAPSPSPPFFLQNSLEALMGKQNIQAKEVYSLDQSGEI